MIPPPPPQPLDGIVYTPGTELCAQRPDAWTDQDVCTQERAAALELARQAAATERAREVRRRFLGTGTPYTPQRVDFYSN